MLKLLIAAVVCCSVGLPLVLLFFLHPATSLQTKDGIPAQSITSAEFTEVMKYIKSAVEASVNSRKLKRGEKWLYSYDNDKVHVGADLTKVGIMPASRFELPACSSDMHKAVEHIHAWLEMKMQQWLEDMEESSLNAEQCKRQLQKFFCEDLQQSSIAADVASLKDTYRAIIAAGGGYPAKKYR
jgi:hypothetical protein